MLVQLRGCAALAAVLLGAWSAQAFIPRMPAALHQQQQQQQRCASSMYSTVSESVQTT